MFSCFSVETKKKYKNHSEMIQQIIYLHNLLIRKSL